MNLLPHQRDAVERVEALLDRFGGAILADDVGLGKSFVAAAIMRDAEEHGAVIDLIVPATLIAQWRETLQSFGVVNARLITHDGLGREPFVVDSGVAAGASPASGGGRGAAEAAAATLGTRRLVVVDEAHAFRNRRTQRWAALARRSVNAQLLLVTATPLCNSADDLHALVVLIAADDALRPAGVASIDDAFTTRDAALVAIITRELVIRRARDVLPPALRFGELVRNVIRYEVVAAPGIDALQFPLIADGTAAPLLRRLLRRRLESSEAALLESLRRQTRFYERALDSLRSGRSLTKRDYRRAFGDEDGEALQQVLFWDAFAPTGAPSATPNEIGAELTRIAAVATDVRGSPCAKRTLLLDLCASVGQPMLIFTTAIATAFDLRDALRRSGVATALAASTGGTPDRAIEAFRRGNVDVLVATDLAAEGLNLQRAGIVVHYDIPWNPVKLEQRNGRAHRLGQSHDAVRAIYFVPQGDETRVMHIVAAKNRARRRIWSSKEVGEETASLAVDPWLPPHLPGDAAALALLGALRARRIRFDERRIVRRHRAGVELLMREMAGEFLDVARVEELLAVIDCEPH